MKLENYTPEIFLENFANDSETFGIETTKAIYEEIFSAICGKKIKLDTFVETLNEDGPYIPKLKPTITDLGELGNSDENEFVSFIDKGTSKVFDSASDRKNTFNNLVSSSAISTMNNSLKNDTEKAAELLSKTNILDADTDTLAAKAAMNATKPGFLASLSSGIFGKLKSFLTTLPAKVKTFFGKLQGKSFSEIMKKGMAWLQANPTIALKTTGGIALIGLLIRALKKRGELKRYENLRYIAERSKALKEDCFDTVLEDTKEKEAMRKILEECETNKALEKAIFGEVVKEKKDYFGY